VPELVRHWAGWAIARYGLVVVFGLLILVFSVIHTDIFFTSANAKTIASTQAVLAIVALATMVPLTTGQFDISLGFQLGLGQALCAGLIINEHWSAGAAVVATLAAGAAIGLANGLLVVALGINSFIATLGTGTVVLGFTQWYTGDQPISGEISSTFLDLGRDSAGPFPLPLIYVLALTALLWIAFEYTAWGRTCFATGANPRAALLAGVRTNRVIVQTLVLAGTLAAAAGVVSVMILGSANPAIGLNYSLPAFAAAFLGASSIRPGRFNAIGTAVAVYMLATGIQGLEQFGVSSYIENFFNGGALLIAVALSILAGRRRREATAR
jgi:ribose transport system permease protein